MPWGEVSPAAQSGMIDGTDLPIVNILAIRRPSFVIRRPSRQLFADGL
jgi:hypothetical protein